MTIGDRPRPGCHTEGGRGKSFRIEDGIQHALESPWDPADDGKRPAPFRMFDERSENTIVHIVFFVF